MTVTESAPPAAPAAAVVAPRPARAGLAGVLTSGDHKVLGRLWIAAAVLGFALTGVVGAMISIERIDTADIEVIDADWFAQIYSLHGISGAFLFLLPLTLGVVMVVVPLQLGASTLAFPRAATASFWAHVLGAGILLGGYIIDGGPFGSDLDGVELYISGYLLVLVAQVLGWICVVTTVLTLRAPGLSLRRVPLFSWSALVAGVVWILTLPVLGAVALLSVVAIRYDQDLFGGADGIYAGTAWVFAQPAVYAFGIVVLGVIADVIPVFSSTRHQRHTVAMGLICAYGALAVGSWALPGLPADPRPWLYEGPWVVVSFAILLPVLGLLGLWADTARRGRPRVASPFVYAIAAGLMLAAGIAAGAVQAIEPLETLVDGDGTPLWGTTWTTSATHYVVLAATIALIGAATYWAPKLLGKSLREAPSTLLALGLLVGTVVLCLPDLIAGLLGQPSQLGAVDDNTSTIETLNLISAIGGGIVLLSALGWVLLVLRALADKETPGDDPWQGHTLEWATSSPPPVGNFATLPEVTSEAPLYDARHLEEASS